MNSTSMTDKAISALEKLKSQLPHIEEGFLVETSLCLTQSLFEKSSQGAVFEVKWPDGKSETLRFSVKKTAKNSSKKAKLASNGFL